MNPPPARILRSLLDLQMDPMCNTLGTPRLETSPSPSVTSETEVLDIIFENPSAGLSWVTAQRPDIGTPAHARILGECRTQGDIVTNRRSLNPGQDGKCATEAVRSYGLSVWVDPLTRLSYTGQSCSCRVRFRPCLMVPDLSQDHTGRIQLLHMWADASRNPH